MGAPVIGSVVAAVAIMPTCGSAVSTTGGTVPLWGRWWASRAQDHAVSRCDAPSLRCAAAACSGLAAVAAPRQALACQARPPLQLSLWHDGGSGGAAASLAGRMPSSWPRWWWWRRRCSSASPAGGADDGGLGQPPSCGHRRGLARGALWEARDLVATSPTAHRRCRMRLPGLARPAMACAVGPMRLWCDAASVQRWAAGRNPQPQALRQPAHLATARLCCKLAVEAGVIGGCAV